MIQKHPKRATRNLVVFEAPVELTDKAKMVAERTIGFLPARYAGKQ